MNYKKWVKIIIFITATILLLVGLFNFIIDPFNIFNHNHKFNKLQVGFNERIQKSVYLKYKSNLEYDSILFGSSRATYYNATYFHNMNLYNYSFSGSTPSEYLEYLIFAKKYNKKGFKNIILALDFYTYSKNSKIQSLNAKDDNKISFFIKNYFTIDTLKYSLINIKRSILNTTGHRSYSRNNIVFSNFIDENIVRIRANNRAVNYYENFNASKDYKKILDKIVNQNKESRFIVFIPPLSKPFLKEIFSNKTLTKFYFEWLTILVSTFENVYSFSIKSELTNNYTKYSLDGDHFYPNISNEVAKNLTMKESEKKYFIKININNIEKIKKLLINLGEKNENSNNPRS